MGMESDDAMINMSTRIHMTTNAETTAKSNDVKLKKYLSEAVASLQVIEGERDQIKNIIEIAHSELEIDKKAFRKAAVKMQKNTTVAEDEAGLEAVRDILDRVTTIS